MSVAMQASGITLQALFRRSARIFADRIAVVDGAGGRHTYRAVDERARQLAGALRAMGLGRGDRIAVLAEPRLEFVEVYIAAAYRGITIVGLNTRLHPKEIAVCVEGAKPRVVFASAALRPLLAESAVENLVDFDADYGPLVDAATPAGLDDAVEPEDIHDVLYTSGTTGKPKGAMISQRAAATRALRLAQWFRLTPDDGFIGWLPMFHCGGDESLYATWLTGGRFACFLKADVGTMFERIASERLSWTLLLPGVINAFVNDPRSANHDLSSLRFAIGYANMMPQLVAELTRKFGISFFDAFGQTETSYLLAHVEVPAGEVPSLRKWPSPLMDVRIVDDEMHEQPVGVAGECVVRGPSVMSGYLDDPEATAEVFRGGFLHTGDVLVRNEDGSLTFTDRKKYLIKTGGENVYPAEVEQVLASHPAIAEACVFGIPDPVWGEAIKAVVVFRQGQSASAEELIAHARAHLAGYKRPKYVQAVEAAAIPRSTTGKILRGELAARYGDSQNA